MPEIATGQLSQQLEKLLSERELHIAALGRIDQTFARIDSLLTGSHGGGSNGSPVAKELVPSKTAAPKKRRGPGTYPTTAAETVLAFIKGNGQAARAEVNAHWEETGRPGSADNALSILVKAGRLKRRSVDGQRGSVYTIA